MPSSSGSSSGFAEAGTAASLKMRGIHPRRALGQNFVVDPNTIRRIVKLAEIEPGSQVLEIGAGLGALTWELVKTGAEVVAVEVDRKLVALLKERFADLPVTIFEADILAMDFSALPMRSRSWISVGNLPYSVAATTIIRLLEKAPAMTSGLFMVQKEVGERLASAPGNKTYGVATVIAGYWADISLVGNVPRTVFYPRPHVDSVLLRLQRKVDPPFDLPLGYEHFLHVVHAGFSQRRKMLRNSLSGIVHPDVFDRYGIDDRSRAEELGLKEWGMLAQG